MDEEQLARAEAEDLERALAASARPPPFLGGAAVDADAELAAAIDLAGGDDDVAGDEAMLAAAIAASLEQR